MLGRILFSMLAVIGLAACNPIEVLDDASAEIDAFHQSWNDTNLDAIWNSTDPEFRNLVGRERTDLMVGDFREILGEVKSSEQVKFDINTDGAGTTVMVVMQTQFTSGEAEETFAYRKRGEGMRLLHYFVRSDALADYDWSKLEGEGFVVDYGDQPAEAQAAE